MVLDIIILIPLLWAAFKGFKNGLIKEVSSLLALCGGIYLAYHFSNRLAEKLELANSKIVAFVIIFIIVVILTFIVGNIVEKVVTWMVPKILDRICGTLFGALKIWIICAIALSSLKNMDPRGIFISNETIGKSKIYPYIEKTVGIRNNYQKKKPKTNIEGKDARADTEKTYDM